MRPINKSCVKKNKGAISAVLFLVLICSILLFTVACGEKKNESDGPKDNAEKVEYSVTLKTAGGMVMSEIDVYVYSGEELQDYAKTNAEGKISFNLPEYDKYSITLSGVPKGYDVAESYAFDGKSADITLTSAVIADEELSTVSLKTGDVMRDFTVATPDGTSITLSEVLKEKKMVMLNFWYTTCSWCLEEFPLMNELYGEYKDDIEIIALNPMEDNNAVGPFQQQHGLDFPMAACPSSWSNTFAITGYPTTVLVDRYGVICVVEAGAITSKRPFVCAFDHFIADDYEQTLCLNGIGDLVTQIKPSYTMPESDVIAELVGVNGAPVTFRAETEDENAEYIWPFIEGEKGGNSCIMPSNKGIDDSYAIIYADVELKAGQAFGFDYLVSSERFCDILYVIVNDEDIFQISGVSDVEEWKSCYPCVADEDGTYEVALCFLKDSDGSEGDDTVYIDNMRVINSSEIDTQTYLPRYAATSDGGDNYSYVNVVFNEGDGYYHVGDANGPLLLADLMNYTPFSEEETLQDIVVAGTADKDGVSLYNKVEEGGAGMVKYFSYASNSGLSGVCTVNKELAEMLKQVADIAGFSDDENEWLKICKYYASYGPDATQLQDPIKGLAPFSAFTTILGKDIESNCFYYDRAIIPRGLLSKFVPEKSGVYRFTSKSDYQDGIDAWIFNEAHEVIYTYEHDERMYLDDHNCSIVYYMEAGKPYYINMAFWDVYATGSIYYDVEYLGESLQLFRLASPGYFTYDGDADGENIYQVITGGITPVLKDGKYYDSEHNSLIYADFTGLTTVFSNSFLEMIEMGGFDFSKSETDGEILAYLRKNDNDVEKTTKYLKDLWGEDFDANCDLYQIDDIFEGRYHGDGPDLTEEVRVYAAQIDKSGTERDGCVVVDERLAEIIQLLMDKYTFENVANSWLKTCYYYDYLGPAK